MTLKAAGVSYSMPRASPTCEQEKDDFLRTYFIIGALSLDDSDAKLGAPLDILGPSLRGATMRL